MYQFFTCYANEQKTKVKIYSVLFMDNTEEKDVLSLNSITSIKLPGYAFFLTAGTILIKINMDLKIICPITVYISKFYNVSFT